MTATIVQLPRGGSARPALRTAEPAERLYWRAVIRTGAMFGASRQGDRLEWHLASCEAPHGEGEHCSQGEHLRETTGNPDGHCLVNGRCGRCGEHAAQRLLLAA